MAVTIIKPAPKLGWPYEDLAEAMVWEAYGDQIAYSDTSPAAMFTVPGNCEVVGIGFRVDTAWTDVVSATVDDSDGNHLLNLGKGAMGDTDSRPFYWRFEKYTDTDYPDGATLSFVWSSADAAAGAITPVLLYRLNSGKQSWVTGAFR
jgi:hypothetical protein